MSLIRSFALAVGTSLAALYPAGAEVITINATADIFSAGRAPGELPLGATTPIITMPLETLPGGIITLEFTGGWVSWGVGGYTDYNPDSRFLPYAPQYSGVYTPSPGSTLSGVSGHRRWFGLHAVFLGDDMPATAPASLNYTEGVGPYTANSPIIAPELGQVFFVGDARVDTADNDQINFYQNPLGSGDLQQFIIPEGATRLYFGFVDDLWSDNFGAYTFNYNFANPVPEPGTMALMAVAALGLGWRLRRRG